MFSYIWHTFFFNPVYNSLVFFVDVVPAGDIGIAIIFTTILIKMILLPLSVKAAKTQKIMREIEPELREIKEKYKDKREEQAQAMLKVYREAGMNPFSAIFVIILQIPLVIALYLSVFGYDGYSLPEINTELLYQFITVPTEISMMFLGVTDMAERSVFLAALVGITMFWHMRFVLPEPKLKKADATPDFKEDFARSMQLQMRYVMPVIMMVIAYVISAAIALYFLVSNIFAILQEFYIRRHRK